MYLSISVFFLSLTLLVGIHIGQETAKAAPKGGPPAIAAYISNLSAFPGGPSSPGFIMENGDVYDVDNYGANFTSYLVGNVYGQ
jgi:hypothetical protein